MARPQKAWRWLALSGAVSLFVWLPFASFIPYGLSGRVFLAEPTVVLVFLSARHLRNYRSLGARVTALVLLLSAFVLARANAAFWLDVPYLLQPVSIEGAVTRVQRIAPDSWSAQQVVIAETTLSK